MSVWSSVARVSTAQGLDSVRWVVLWHLLQGLVGGGKPYRIPPISTAEREEKRALFDERTRRVWPNAELNARAKSTKENVRDNFGCLSWRTRSTMTMQSKQRLSGSTRKLLHAMGNNRIFN